MTSRVRTHPRKRLFSLVADVLDALLLINLGCIAYFLAAFNVHIQSENILAEAG